MTHTLLFSALASISGTAAVLFSYFGFLRARKRDSRQDGQHTGAVMTELGYIKSGIDDIKTEQREQRKINTEFATELASVKASAKQAHLRIDRMEGREYPTPPKHE